MLKTYEITIRFDKNQSSDEHFEELIKQVKSELTGGLPASKGTAEARLVSFSALEE